MEGAWIKQVDEYVSELVTEWVCVCVCANKKIVSDRILTEWVCVSDWESS